MRSSRFLLLAILVVAVPGLRAAAATPAAAGPLRAAPLGPIVEAPDGRSEMELVRFDESVTARLQALAPEETLLVDDWPVAPGARSTVVLRRFDVYAPDARIVVIEGGREIEVPRSRTVFFMGAGIDGLGRFAVGLDPETGTFRGSRSEDGTEFELRPREDGSGLHRFAARSAFDPEGTPARSWSCGQEELPLDAGGPSEAHGPAEPADGRAPEAIEAATRVAVIAVDTDNEFMNLKFGNNAANATTYIAALFAAHNVIYERDASLRLLQGYTILRPSTTADPYLQSGTGNADSAKLVEFRDYWNLHYPTTVVRRALAMLLSGKQASNNSASGIAYVPGLCSASGYSFNQVFKFAAQTASSDIGVVAHEVGHNMSSPHTHCYADPKPDTCYSGEACYSGATACPTLATYNGVSARGTLMSYCHVLSGCDKADVFHTFSLSRYLNGAVSGASCIFAIGAAAPTLTNVSPATGPLAGGTVLTLTGTNFASGATVAFVELPSNDVFGSPSSKVAAVTFNSATQLTVTTPSATNVGAVDVVVMNPDFQTATRAGGFTYGTAPPAPTVTAVSPNTGSTAGGGLVTITGTGFVSTPTVPTVTFGGTSATRTFVNSTTLTATVPAHAAGIVNVVVTNPDLQAGTLTNGFAYLPPSSASRYYVITPCRLFDTRNSTGADSAAPILAAGGTRTFDVSGRCGVPDTALALTVNVTVTGSAAAGELRLFPGNSVSPNPPASALFYGAGKTRANNDSIRLATDGTATLKVHNVSAGSVHFILDVSGYYLLAP